MLGMAVMSPPWLLILAVKLLSTFTVVGAHQTRSYGPAISSPGYLIPVSGKPGTCRLLNLNATKSRYTVKSPLECEIKSVRLIGSNGIDRSFYHIVVDHQGKYTYEPGEYCGVLPPGLSTRNNRPHPPRSYSLAPVLAEDKVDTATCFSLGISAPIVTAAEREKFKNICICSQFLSNAEPGARIRITGPFGKLVLSPEELSGKRNLLLLATGTGIVPYMGFLDALLQSHKEGPAPGRILLLFGVQSPETFIYRDTLERYVEQFDGRLQVIVAYSRYGYPPERGYVQDQITKRSQQILELCTGDSGTCSVFLCGRKSMEKDVIAALHRVLADNPNRELILANIKSEVYE